MIAIDSAGVLGSVGVALLLAAYFLNLVKLCRADGFAYGALNFFGAALACLSSYLIGFMPFVVLEGTWMVVSAVALARAIVRPPRSPA